jgi:hypothetical protein
VPATDPLPSWNDTGTRQAIVEFVEAVTGDGGDGYVPPVERVAVLDSEVITKHYAGDDSDVKVLLGGILQAFAGMESRSTRPPPTPSSTPASTRPSAAASPSGRARWSGCGAGAAPEPHSAGCGSFRPGSAGGGGRGARR